MHNRLTNYLFDHSLIIWFAIIENCYITTPQNMIQCVYIMSRRVTTTIKFVSLVIIGFLAAVFIKNNLSEFRRILELKAWQFALLSCLVILELTINGWIFKTALKIFHVKLNVREWFGLTVLNRYSNYLLIKGGPVARGYYLKQVHGMNFRRFLVIVSFLSFLQLGVIGVLSSFTLGIRYFLGHNFNVYLFFFFLALFLLSLMPFILPRRWLKKLAIKLAWFKGITEGWLKIRKEFNLAAKLFLPFLLLSLVYSLKIFLIYAMIFSPVPFTSTILITASAFLSFFVALTPASIGIKEALMSYTAKLTGDGFASTAVVAAVDRGITMVWVIGLGIIFSIWYSRKILELKRKNHKG